MASWGSLAPDTLLPPPDNPATPPEWWNERVRNAARAFGSLVTFPGRAMQQGITTEEAIPWAADTALGMVGTPGTPAGALGSSIKPIRAYHGSPHDFDRFDLSKVGTGEGAQAYGHGLYFAENPETARTYREALAGQVNNPARNQRMAELAREMSKYEIPGQYRKYSDPRGYELAKQYDELMNARAADKGKMYEVNINAEPQQFLDWDKPLSRQSPEVADRLASVIGPVPQDTILSSTWNTTVPGALKNPEMLNPDIFRTPQKDFVARGWSGEETFQKAGIPGIKYLDQGSRREYQVVPKNGEWGLYSPADGREGLNSFSTKEAAQAEASRLNEFERTSNYVVFDDKLIDILRKYGLTGMLGGGGAGGAAFGSLAPRSEASR